ncbi:dynein regulatory complex subunit 7 [Parambassis ranga]|uniref:Dynein regulatory complex subunit 7 n=1 Tax=Parambassis ranga TaxID=210632 RepID=A0A6P7HTD4_9TELE|nr:dynein regulatory complex subunit 7 [Parambassis ranga]
MESVLESDSEQQVTGGESQEEKSTALTKELLPQSYRTNSCDETQLLAIAENFRRQYSHLYPTRRPLLLCPTNECGVKKFVSTSLRPTTTPHSSLQAWQGCASFVADFLSLEPLEPPTELPSCLSSLTWVLQTQRATCFEFATLLCSLLLGINYDAYCVSGYAVREMCLLDQSLQNCPLLDTEAKSAISEQNLQESENTVKPLRELKSRFLTQQEQKKKEAEAALLQKQKLQEELQCEQRPDDLLRGLRVHCWVLVLSGSQSIQENFFIDPLTGNTYPTHSNNFLGIESVWNNFNYYVNVQDCRNGCAEMEFDLEDLKMWEPLLYGSTSKKQLDLAVLKKKEREVMSQITKMEQLLNEEVKPKVFEMPRSWVNSAHISHTDLQSRFPGGQKTTHFRKAKLERFAPCLRSNGLITRLTTYRELDCMEEAVVKEWYHYRNDHLEEKEVNKLESVTIERFRPGRRFDLISYGYRSLTRGTQLEVEFGNTHPDNLVRRVLSPVEMIDTYEGRADFLYYRHAYFNQEKPLDPDKGGRKGEMENLRIVVERFHRNESKPANEDVAERVFLVAQGRIELTYHLIGQRFIPSKRSFIKPRKSSDKQKDQEFTLDMVSTFQVDLSERPLGFWALRNMLEALITDEKEVVGQITNAKMEMTKIMTCREEEEKGVQICDPEAEARKRRAELQAQVEMEKLQKDPLAPFLVQYGCDNPESITMAYQDCLADFKHRLERQTALIQERLEQETQELQKRQQWYQQNQPRLSKQQVDGYKDYCSEKSLRISATRKRLNWHIGTATEKYKALAERLRNDPRVQGCQI